jgi:hypothetical protein
MSQDRGGRLDHPQCPQPGSRTGREVVNGARSAIRDSGAASNATAIFANCWGWRAAGCGSYSARRAAEEPLSDRARQQSLSEMRGSKRVNA